MNNKLLTIGETAQLIGISIDTLREWDKNGILLSFRPNSSGHRYYRSEDIENFLKKPNRANDEDMAKLGEKWVMAKAPITVSPSFYCETNDTFRSPMSGFSVKIHLRIDDYLRNPVMVAQIYEYYSAVVPYSVDPA